jgi:superkiller protein 3
MILSHDPSRIPEALEELARAQRTSPREPLIPYLMGSLKFQQGDAAGAIAALERAVELDPSQPHALYTLAQAYIRAGQRERGRAVLQDFQERKRKSADQDARQRTALGSFGRGRELLAAGDVAGAAQFLREAAAADPGNPHSWAQLAKVELSLGEAVAALESISMARGLAPGESEYLYLESVALAQLGRPQEAQTSAAEAVRRDPTVAAYQNQLGLILQKLNRLAEALAAYRRAVELMPQEASFLLNLATALEASGDREGSAAAMARYHSVSKAGARTPKNGSENGG